MEDGNFHNLFVLFLLVATLNPVYFVALMNSQLRDLHKKWKQLCICQTGGGEIP